MNPCLNLAIASGLLFIAITPSNIQAAAPSENSASTCIHESEFQIPKNKLLNFGCASRVPNSYIIAFMGETALAKITMKSAAHRSEVLPDVLPTSLANCAALASAFAARFGGSVFTVWCGIGGVRGFAIKGISEAAIADLAQDDRVEFVEADELAKLD